MKKLLCLVLTLLMLVTLGSGLTAHAATGSLTVNASATSVTIGSTVSVTLKYSTADGTVGSFQSQFQYNAKAFQYISAAGDAAVNGNAGILNISYFALTYPAPQSASVTLTFKAIAVGDGNFGVTTTEFSNDDETSLGKPSQTVAVAAINPTKSANANLASIKPSSGTLTPAFNPNVTSYTIAVPYTTTSLSLSATTQDKGAKTAVSGKNTLAVGKNTQVITVTAPNGTTKKYTVVITRAASQTTTTTTSGTTLPKPDPLEVEVNGVLMTVTDTQPNAALPDGFKWDHITINNIDVSAAINPTVNLTLIYLNNPTDKTGAFYIYDKTADRFSPFCPLKVNGGEYILLEMPAGQTAPAGTVVGKKKFGDMEREVFLFEDTAMADVALVYATSPAGKTALYMYDATDGSIQLYRTVIVPTTPQPDSTTQPTGNAFTQFVTQNRTVILICAAGTGGAALLIASIVLLLLISRHDKKGKH